MINLNFSRLLWTLLRFFWPFFLGFTFFQFITYSEAIIKTRSEIKETKNDIANTQTKLNKGNQKPLKISLDLFSYYYLRKVLLEKKNLQNIYGILLLVLLKSGLVIEYLYFRINPPPDIRAYCEEIREDSKNKGFSEKRIRIEIEKFYLDSFGGYVVSQIENIFLAINSSAK